MSTLPPFARLLVQGALVLGWAVSAASGGPGVDSPEPDVATLIRKLGDPSFQVRTEATRRLCMLGTPVRTQLEEAAKGSDIEIALRAKALLGIMDELLFSGCRLTLTASRSRVAWNEPLDLILTVQNTSTHPGTIPFERSAPDGRNADADQVAGLIDAADFLVVTGPDGMPVSFHLDTADPVPAVEALVRNRADASPSSRLVPGRTRQHRMTTFNRGRARYPLLRAGTYRITVVYTPKWDDAEFT
ncbi:MAG: hypothetical protein GY842_26945, partial [bacterium]|nr:hypothetical protein [bacterium]